MKLAIRLVCLVVSIRHCVRAQGEVPYCIYLKKTVIYTTVRQPLLALYFEFDKALIMYINGKKLLSLQPVVRT